MKAGNKNSLGHSDPLDEIFSDIWHSQYFPSIFNTHMKARVHTCTHSHSQAHNRTHTHRHTPPRSRRFNISDLVEFRILHWSYSFDLLCSVLVESGLTLTNRGVHTVLGYYLGSVITLLLWSFMVINLRPSPDALLEQSLLWVLYSTIIFVFFFCCCLCMASFAIIYFW